ncbi:DNA polymerase III subunit beta [Opitutaceae bacterium TAV4]|uniref:DNA polymerase III subunit beta n=1 Tax=Geminisphaera colitermitum TaxID=1148786 RepID=UPI000158CCDD|nr:DNA polymerase III subunit beta [Geminisphaera colitermitum]RRJ95206.1 DNA polymerase III subunit beta [Opitutaceae bacterium TAV4]RRJ99463.1 DNA polymerase III subunit beta [Opitutaceae bacterium TAV3]
MKFKINRDHFSNGLAQVLNVVGSKATMPILSNVLIEAEKDYISLTTTNLDLGIRCKIKAEVKEPGSVTLPVKRLATIVRELPSVDVAFDGAANHQVKLTSGGSTFKIMGIGKDEFPPLPEFGDDRSFNLSQEELTTMLKSVSYAQSTDETRYILNGVYFNFRDAKLTLVATDGRRLALTSKEMEIPEESAGAIILPAKTVGELLRMLGKGAKIKIAFNDRRASFEISTEGEDTGLVDSIYLYSKVVEGNYPNYQQVIPKETHQRIKLERELFAECVHRAALVCSDKSNQVRIKLSTNLLEITAQSPDFGEAHESMAIAYSGPDLQVAFNPAFVMDPLKALTKDEVFFELKDEVSPGVFKTLESFICVIMPVRLG